MTENNIENALTDILETFTVHKYYDEDFETGGEPYEIVSMTFKNGVLVEESVVRKEDN